MRFKIDTECHEKSKRVDPLYFLVPGTGMSEFIRIRINSKKFQKQT